jgi:uncharacterized protein
MMNMDPVVHFEMPAEDRGRMISFYSKVFGWQAKQLGPDMGNFVSVETTESENNIPKKSGAINGGFYQKTGDVAQTTTLTIQVDDLKAYRDEIVKAGGKIAGDIMDMPNIGSFLSFFDTEGNRVNLIQPAR